MAIEHVDPDDRAPAKRPSERWEPLADAPIGPDDAGNVAMHALQLIATGWRRLRARFSAK